MSVFEINRVDVHLLLQLDAAAHRIHLPRTMGQRIWAGLIAELPADDVSVMFMGVVIAERELELMAWKPATSLPLLQAIQDHDDDLYQELAEWAADHTINSYTPLGRREASCARLIRTDLTPEDAAFAYARAWNRLTDLFLRGLIADDVLYTSDDGPITGKRVFLEHQWKRMQLFWQCKLPVFAEIGAIRNPGKAPEPCVIIAYGSKDSLAGVVRLQTQGEFIQRIEMDSELPLHTTRTGLYPQLGRLL